MLSHCSSEVVTRDRNGTPRPGPIRFRPGSLSSLVPRPSRRSESGNENNFSRGTPLEWVIGLGFMGEELDLSEEQSRCSFPCLLGVGLIVWGALVLVTALCSLAITSSYFVVFPFGAPLWTGSLFITLGVFMLVAFRMGAQPLAMPSKAQVIFTLIISLVATCEALLAVALSVWYSEATLPALQSCTPQSFFSQPPHTCECSVGFINPPSLLRMVYRFHGVSNCSQFGMWLRTIHRILHALYSTGVVLSLVVIITACKKLHSAGFCGKSGIYLVTPAGSSVSRQPSVGSSAIGLGHTAGGGLSIITQRFASSQATLNTNNHSPAIHPARPHISPTHPII